MVYLIHLDLIVGKRLEILWAMSIKNVLFFGSSSDFNKEFEELLFKSSAESIIINLGKLFADDWFKNFFKSLIWSTVILFFNLCVFSSYSLEIYLILGWEFA